MKSYIKGIITGLIIAVAVQTIPALGDSVDVLLNRLRININGIDKAQWGEEITLDNGERVPYSILYKGTTYLPLRKIGEFNGKKVCWNGDTFTAALVDQPQNEKVLTEKTDKNGNLWTYYTFNIKNGDCYLGVIDKNRNFERIYQLVGGSVKITDKSLYFMRITDRTQEPAIRDTELVRIDFENDENSQDGTVLYSISQQGYVSDAIFEEDYMFYAVEVPGNGSYGQLVAYNILTGKTVYHNFHIWTYIRDLSVSSGESNTINFSWDSPGAAGTGEIEFDKASECFGEPIFELVK